MNNNTIKEMYSQGKSYREIEKETGLNRGTISYYCKKETRERKRIKRLENRINKKIQCIEYKGGKCVCCGFNKYNTALDFHHLDPKAKDLNIAESFARNHSLERIKKELDKCVLVCSNCHRAIHNGEITLTDNSRVPVSHS